VILKLCAASKLIRADEYTDWPFSVGSIKVYFTKPNFYLARIGEETFALTGATSTYYEIPTYFKSPLLKPKGHATYLLETAQGLNPYNQSSQSPQL
jgi:hypothetical protein